MTNTEKLILSFIKFSTVFWFTNIFSIFIIALWIFSVAVGGDFYNYLNIFISSFLGKFIVIGCSWSLLFYFLAEIRHIVWDLGYGYEIKTANISGIFIFILSLVLTLIVWVAIW